MSEAPPITLTIDGREVACPPGSSVLEAATQAGIAIPNLCAHPTLKPFGRCRLCIVEIDGVRGYPSACTTPVTPGAVVRTTTPAVTALRRTTLELLLTEHPTGCLMCLHQDDCLDHHGCHARRSGTVTGCRFCPRDQRCELQALVQSLGVGEMGFPVKHRGLPVDRRDPFFDRDYNLCILCARCVRACDERRHAGAVALTNRGATALVGTAYDQPLTETSCQFCGSCVDVCPTAALAERVNKWIDDPAETTRTTCPFCSLGCAIELETLAGQVVASRPAGGELCAKGRFAAVETCLAENRLLRPMVRRDMRLVETDWDTALARVAEGLAGCAWPALYASQDLLDEELLAVWALAVETLETPHLDTDAPLTDGAAPRATATLDDLRSARLIVTVRTDLRYSHTPVFLAIAEAVAAGAELICVEPFGNDLLPLAREVHRERRLPTGLLDRLRSEPEAVVVWGSALAQSDDGAAVMVQLTAACDLLLPLLAGANGRGARELGIVPQRGGRGLCDWFTADSPVDALLSFGHPPLPGRPTLRFWVAACTSLDDASAYADVVLPMAVFSEVSGRFTDLLGRHNAVTAAVPPAGECRDVTTICEQLAARLAGVIRSSSAGLRRPRPSEFHCQLVGETLTLVREASAFTYLGSPLTQRVPGFEPLAFEDVVRIHPDDALRLGLRHGAPVSLETETGAVDVTIAVSPGVAPGLARLVVRPGEDLLGGSNPCRCVLEAADV